MKGIVHTKGIVNWQKPPLHIKLDQYAVHVWYTNIQSYGHNYSDNYALLSPQERERTGRYKFNRDKERFVARRSMCRKIIKKYPGDVISGFEIRTNSFGKPEIWSPTRTDNYTISLSHSQNAIIVALSKITKIGVDIEYIKKIEFKSMLRTVLPPASVEKIDALHECEDAVSFYRIWTSIEAYLKALGKGFMLSLDDEFWTNFPFDVFENRITNPNWSAVQFFPDKDIFSTLVANTPEIQPSFFMFNR